MLKWILRDPVIHKLAGEILRAEKGPALRGSCRGSYGASTTFVAGALWQLTGRPTVLVCAHVDEAEEAIEELRWQKIPAVLFPALETLPGESSISLDALGDRLMVVQLLRGALVGDQQGGDDGQLKKLPMIVAPIPALMQPIPTLNSLESLLRVLRRGEEIGGGPAGLARWLSNAGYQRVETIEEPGDFAVRGGVVDVFPPGDPTTSNAEQSADASLGGVPIRVEFFDDTVERLHEVDLASMGVDRQISSAQLVCAKAELATSEPATGGKGSTGGTASRQQLAELLPTNATVIVHEVLEVTEQARGYFERVSDGSTIFGPPAVFASLGKRASSFIELNSLSNAPGVGRAGGGATAHGQGLNQELSAGPVPPIEHDLLQAIAELGKLALGGDGTSAPMDVTVTVSTTSESDRLRELLATSAPDALDKIHIEQTYVHAGFTWTHSGQTRLILPYAELLHRFTARRRKAGPKLRSGRTIDTFVDLRVGDHVVHTEHGIARFVGLVQLRPREVVKAQVGIDQRLASLAGMTNADDLPLEHLILEFEGSAKLYVPATKIDQVSKYVGGFRGKPPLSTLGGERWKNQKKRVGESVRDLAAEMLRVRAARDQLPGIRYPTDSQWQQRFEDEFPHQETEDQLAALSEIKKDMSSAKPMDRLLCGDVGFGKTEMAIRAAFKAAEFGKQTAVLVPTTVLAEQHERTFKSRFADYPFRVESISRFKTASEEKELLAKLAQGSIDVMIGTHRLLSKDVNFKDLGLVVIDEEQRFGVEHKERLLSLRMTADILTLSATPIPRTLHMSMLGLRDISSLTTPPLDRRAVVTEVIPYQAGRIKQIIDRELAREGQVFYVHNRVHDILSVADDVQKLAQGARVVVGHGQMSDGELEKVILAFVRGQADILVSTTIIESGIDIPRANTIIIEDADRFGLAELHQLRGRVGRSKHRGYCYLLLPERRPLKEHAKQRLKALERYSMLGAGFKIAMRDLEIRGAGNILGAEQSGHIATVGYDMYCQLLDRAVKSLNNESTAAPSETVVEIGIFGSIPQPYIPSDMRRLEAYRRIALCGSLDDVQRVRTDLTAAYGAPPAQVCRLLDLAELRIAARDSGVRLITIKDRDVIIRTTAASLTAQRLQGPGYSITVLPAREVGQTAEIYMRAQSNAGLEPPTLLTILTRRLGAHLALAKGTQESAADIAQAQRVGKFAPAQTLEASHEKPLPEQEISPPSGSRFGGNVPASKPKLKFSLGAPKDGKRHTKPAKKLPPGNDA